MASDDINIVFQEESNSSDEDSSADSSDELSFHCSGDDVGSDVTADDMSPILIVEETNDLRSCTKKDTPEDENKKKCIRFIETPEIKYYVPDPKNSGHRRSIGSYLEKQVNDNQQDDFDGMNYEDTPAEDVIVMESNERVMFLDDIPLLAADDIVTPDGDSDAEPVTTIGLSLSDIQCDDAPMPAIEVSQTKPKPDNGSSRDDVTNFEENIPIKSTICWMDDLYFPPSLWYSDDSSDDEMYHREKVSSSRSDLIYSQDFQIDGRDNGAEQMTGNVPGTLKARSTEVINRIDNDTQPMSVGAELEKEYRFQEEATTWYYPPINVVCKAGQTSLISAHPFSHSASSPFKCFGRVGALTASRSLEATPASVKYTVDRDCYSHMGNFISKKFDDSSNGSCRLRSHGRLPDHLQNESPPEASTGADDIDMHFDSYRADAIDLDFDSSHADDCDTQDSNLVLPEDNAAAAKDQRMYEYLADVADDQQQVPQTDQLSNDTLARTHSLEDIPTYTVGDLGLLKKKKRRSVASWIRKKFNGLRRLLTCCSGTRSKKQIELEGTVNVNTPTVCYTVSKEVFV